VLAVYARLVWVSRKRRGFGAAQRGDLNGLGVGELDRPGVID